jgi:16S rRNA C1402 N4-methylase RsmH
MVLGKLNLNKEQGLEQNLNTWDSDQLISILRGLGEYRQLPEVTRNQVEGRIKSQVGTIGDIIKIMNTGGEFNV